MEKVRTTETAVFGGGCFWCTEAAFKMVKGVIAVMSGYAGGTKPNLTYEDVCAGTTGHAEAVCITYNPSVVSYRDLLTVFFATHDPTTPNRQGSDVGTQYRSLILYTTQVQKTEAEEFITELNAAGGPPLVTEVAPLEAFYEAEQSHRDYYAHNREQAYCQLVIDPKLQKLQEQLPTLLRH